MLAEVAGQILHAAVEFEEFADARMSGIEARIAELEKGGPAA